MQIPSTPKKFSFPAWFLFIVHCDFYPLNFLRYYETFEQLASNGEHKEHVGCAAAGKIYLWWRLYHS